MRILIVEDELKLSNFLRRALEAEYFAVDTADNGELGSHYAQINEYDLIVLDTVLPKKSGVDALREMRSGGIDTPVLMVSARSVDVTQTAVLNAGADGYLAKPFVLAEFLAHVRVLLRRPKAIEREIFSIDDLTLDTRRYSVTRSGKNIYLTRKEFMLLHYLMQHEDIVVSRGMILEHVWDMNTDIFSNTIESHMLSLRKKLGDTGQKRLIQTIPNRGYKIGHS